MDVIFYFIFLTMTTFSKSASNESEDLIEKCPSPWTSYNTKTVSPLGCRNKCGKGKAFHSKDGKLICFYEKGVAHPKPHPGHRTSSSKNTKCECVYFVPSMRLQWLPCEGGNNIMETTVEICEQICERTTVYLYKLGLIRTVVYCENEERLEFYDMAGQNGEVIYYENNSNKVKYRECTCGIASTELKPTTVEKINHSAVAFQECSKPWETLELLKISVLETCKIRCQLVCKRGSGIIYKGEAFCFMRFATAKKRTSFYGAVEGACECGYIKKNNNEVYGREFIPCDPPITKNGLSGKKCDEFCSKSTAYIHKKVRQQLSIRCIYEPEQKPKSLAGKCDQRIYQKQRENSTISYTKCSCGMKEFLGQIFQKRIKFQNSVEIKLPDGWAVKKKRSIRSHTGCKKEEP